MAALARRYQRRAAETVHALQIGAGREGETQDLEMAAGARIQIGAVLDVVLGVDIRARRDQGARDVDLVAMGREEERGSAGGVARVNAGAGAEQALHLGSIAARR